MAIAATHRYFMLSQKREVWGITCPLFLYADTENEPDFEVVEP